MVYEFFTDGVMLAVCLITALVLVHFAIFFWRWGGHWNIWWWMTLAYLVPHSMITVYYAAMWQSGQSVAIAFPLVGQLFRPGLFGVFCFVVVNKYLLYRTLSFYLKPKDRPPHDP